MTWMIWKTTTDSAEATERLGETIGRRLRGGEVIELVSDLGGGKTTFVRGLARGAGSRDHVASPTFTVVREYRTGRLTIHHFDFYRLPDAGVLGSELHELLQDPHAVVAVEWSDIVRHVLPARRLTIDIRQTPEGARELACRFPSALSYLIEGKS